MQEEKPLKLCKPNQSDLKNKTDIPQKYENEEGSDIESETQ